MKPPENLEMRPNEHVVKKLKPTWRSGWFLLFGAALGPAVIIMERDPDGHPAKWIAFSALFLLLFIHRLGMRYVVTNRRILASQWWGLWPLGSVSLAWLGDVDVRTGFGSRLVGCGHIWVGSNHSGERGLNILGQPAPELLAEELEELGRAARAENENGRA